MASNEVHFVLRFIKANMCLCGLFVGLNLDAGTGTDSKHNINLFKVHLEKKTCSFFKNKVAHVVSLNSCMSRAV